MKARSLLKILPRSLRDIVIRRGYHLDEQAIQHLDVRLAEREDEHLAAHRLVHEMYVRRGIIAPTSSGVRVTPHQLLPSTAVFIARQGAEVVGTLSLVIDSPLGLPMETVYPGEIDALRGQPRRLAEVGALSLAHGHRGTGAMYLLCRAMFDHAQAVGRDDLVIAIHPDAADYYRANILFEVLGPVRPYPGLARRPPAIAMRLDLRTFHDRALARHGRDRREPSNPYWLWFARDNPQITRMDRSEVGVRRQLEARRRGAVRLATSQPGVLRALDADARAHLAVVVPALAPVLYPAPPRAVDAGDPATADREARRHLGIHPRP